MKKLSLSIFHFLFFILCAAALGGCALGPLANHETARSVGKGMHELSFGAGNAPPFFKWSYGATENFDLGLHAEATSIGIRGKYSFINQTQGVSFAGALGIGNSIGGSHQYGDLLVSGVYNWFEPYGAVRYAHVNTDPFELKDKDTGNVFFETDEYEYNYAQVFLGSRFWFSPKWYLGLEFSAVKPISSKLNIGGTSLLTVGLGVRF
ncbi:hypothetical protein [Bdellovibrio reynosensis]|uniref:Outer membrane protein beta-barrel domain-containing protein n=1 Tax=Bdellovibrio reynosensis TaxID=2835041 RepID=A0ABY4CCH2_9BACT|nr:hypothetical protein [Bdellovibrio reynosensis]UOF02645.1 hypothetical protein MNR06_06740 [Bdellovibrio reynosensis]